MIYLLIGFIIIIIAYLEVIENSPAFSRYSILLISLTLILFAGLRHNVGTDWEAYYNVYKYRDVGFIEMGYMFLNNTFSDFKLPYNIFLLTINSISIILVYKFIYKNSYLLVIPILIFYSDLYIYFNLSGIRQAIAIAITCYSITFAIEKRRAKFLMLTLLASLFHITSLIFVLAYYIPKSKIKTKHLLLTLCLFYVTFLAINNISFFNNENLLKKILWYTSFQENPPDLFTLYIIGTIKRFIVVGLIILFGNNLLKKNNNRYFFNIYLFGLIIYLSSYMLSPDIGVRISSYFIIFEIILVGNLIYTTKRISNRLIIVTIFSIVSLYKLIGIMNDNSYNYSTLLNFF